MADSQSSGGGGDGSLGVNNSKFNAASPSSPWTNLPLSVYGALAKKMNVKDLRSMRLVCTKWRSNVEQHVGLKVKVDHSIPGNLDFVKRTNVLNARILNWTVDNQLFAYPDRLRKLDLCEKMPANWKIHDLRHFPNLAHLVLRYRALHQSNLTGHQYPVLTFDPNSQISLEDALIQAYETQELPSEPQPIELKSLQTLELHITDFYRETSDNDDTEPPEHVYLVADANVSFILSHIKSPLLSVIYLDMVGSTGALQKLLINNQTSLSQLFLPNFSHDYLEYVNVSLPINLRKLKLGLEGAHRDLYTREAPIQTPFTHLQKCLDKKPLLEEVHLDFYTFPLKWTTDAFTTIANSCFRTLRYLELQWYPNQRFGVLDLEMLSICQRLEVLHLPSWGRTWITFRNVDKLPISLKRLVLCEGESGQIEIGDPNFFKRLTSLKWLYLDCIQLPIASSNGNQGPERQFCRTMIKGLLGLRKLQGFYLNVLRLELNWDSNLVKMLSPLDKMIQPASRKPQTSVRFNLIWWKDEYTKAPWSDRPFFDKETLDLVLGPKHQEIDEDTVRRHRITFDDLDGNMEDEQDDDIDLDVEDEDIDLDEEDVSSSDEDD